MKVGEKLYFVALVPPEPVFSQVEEIKKEISEKFNTHASLRSPPHITLHMPFAYKEVKEHEILEALGDIKIDNKVEIHLDGFGAFPRRVIFIKVTPDESLNYLHNKIVDTLRKKIKVIKGMYRNQGFTPHMTVAFRDLRPVMFDEAWLSIQSDNFGFQWEARSFCLLKHNGRYWEIFKEFSIT